MIEGVVKGYSNNNEQEERIHSMFLFFLGIYQREKKTS